MSANATVAGQRTAATGTVTFTDTAGLTSTTSKQPLNAYGVAEWATGVFAPGNHIVSESYSGDASYKASSAANAAAFLIIPGSTYLWACPLTNLVSAGAQVAVDVELTTGYLPLYGKMPTGNVTVKLGNQSATVPWQKFGTAGNSYLEAVASFSNVPAGILPVTASYAGDANWLGSTGNGGTVVALSNLLTPKVVLTSNTTNPAPGQTFTLTAAVSGPSGKPAPTGSVLLLTDDESVYYTLPLTKGVGSIRLSGWSVANGTNVFTALYEGDANYNAGTSNILNITVAEADFSLVTLNAEVSIARTKSGTASLVLTPINAFGGTVTLTATAPAGITAKPAASTLNVNAATAGTISIAVAGSLTPGTYQVVVTASGSGHVHKALVLVAVT